MALLVFVFVPKTWGQQGQSLFERIMKNFELDMERQMKRFEHFFQTGPFMDLDKMFPHFDNSGVEPFWRETEERAYFGVQGGCIRKRDSF